MGGFAVLATFWTLPTSFLTGSAAAGGIALIGSNGNLGGFFQLAMQRAATARAGDSRRAWAADRKSSIIDDSRGEYLTDDYSGRIERYGRS